MEQSKILDSGQRRQFESGAVRDIQEGKGRCDLIPLSVASHLMPDEDSCRVLNEIGKYIETQDPDHLYLSLVAFCKLSRRTSYIRMTAYENNTEMLLDVAKHYEEGCNKYGERNWEKGIDLHCFIDSGVRHFLKLMSGRTDEPHQRAFVWNILGALWTIENRPDLCDCSIKEVSSPPQDVNIPCQE